MRNKLWLMLMAAAAAGFGGRAHAVPSYAAQTGLPCTACHIGAFGPQLTPYGRAFKIQGYTATGGSGVLGKLPISAFLLGSYTSTAKDQSGPAAPDFASNNNPAIDQVSLFLAGRLSDHVGAFIQGTYDGVGHAFFSDNADIRVVTSTRLWGMDADLGLSLNNSPGLSDPYNSTYPFGYEFVASALALSPNAGTLLSGGLAGNSIGLNGYIWLDQHIYVDLGLYDTMAPGLMKILGEAYGPGSETGVAPYARALYDWNWGDNNAHIGGSVFYSRFNPATDVGSANGSFGHDRYTDLFADGGYQYLTDKHTFTLDGRYDYEIQNLQGSSNPFSPYVASSQPNNNLQEARETATYYYNQSYGLTFSWDKIWGKRNQLLYNTGAPDTGSIKGSPNSNAFISEVDWVPFGHDSSWGAPLANFKIGLQYTIYTQFNGSSTNYDGYGRNASDNNTLYLFVWTAI